MFVSFFNQVTEVHDYKQLVQKVNFIYFTVISFTTERERIYVLYSLYELDKWQLRRLILFNGEIEKMFMLE